MDKEAVWPGHLRSGAFGSQEPKHVCPSPSSHAKKRATGVAFHCQTGARTPQDTSHVHGKAQFFGCRKDIILFGVYAVKSSFTFLNFQSIYFDEPLSARSLEENDTDLPAWVTGELRDDTDDSLSAALLKDKLSSTPIAGHRRYCSNSTNYYYMSLLKFQSKSGF